MQDFAQDSPRQPPNTGPRIYADPPRTLQNLPRMPRKDLFEIAHAIWQGQAKAGPPEQQHTKTNSHSNIGNMRAESTPPQTSNRQTHTGRQPYKGRRAQSPQRITQGQTQGGQQTRESRAFARHTRQRDKHTLRQAANSAIASSPPHDARYRSTLRQASKQARAPQASKHARESRATPGTGDTATERQAGKQAN